MPYDVELAEAMRAALAKRRHIVEKKMFGGICWMLKGNMLCGVEVGRFLLRVGKEQEAEALSRKGAQRMEMAGKPMAGFVWVEARHASGDALQSWIDLAAQYVAQLPPKTT